MTRERLASHANKFEVTLRPAAGRARSGSLHRPAKAPARERVQVALQAALGAWDVLFA